MKTLSKPLLLSAIAAVGFAGSASAQIIPLVNADFEADFGSDNQEVPDWFDFQAGGGDLIQQETDDVSVPDDAGTDTNWLNLVDRSRFPSAAGVYQSFGTHEAGISSYDLTFTIGDRSSDPGVSGFDTVIVDLYAGSGTGADGTNIASVAGLNFVSSFTIEGTDYFSDTENVATDTRSLSATGVGVGETLWLSLRTDDDFPDDANIEQALVDDLSVTAVVPEPSAFALLAGCFGLTWVMLRRRS